MKGWILYYKNIHELNDTEDSSVLQLLEIGKQKGIELEIYKPEDFELIIPCNNKKSVMIHGVEKELPDFVFPRIGSYTSYFGLAVIRQLEHLGVYSCNSADSIEAVKDKLNIHQVLAQSNLPTPKTMLLKFPINIDLVTQEIGFPLVVKNVVGNEGKGIYLCDSADKFKDLMELLESYNSNMNIIIQEFVSTSKGVDLRVFVIGGRVLGCMKRTASQGFKANFVRGGTVEKFEITPEIEWLATETSRILNLDVAGIDLLFGVNGYKVLEANSSPGFKGISQALGFNVAEQVIDYIILCKTSYVE